MKKEPEILDFFGIPIGHFPDRSTRWLFQNKEFVQDLLEILASELVEWNVLISIVSHRLTGVLSLFPPRPPALACGIQAGVRFL